MSVHTLHFRLSARARERLDDFLFAELPAALSRLPDGAAFGPVSRSKTRRLILSGAVSTNGRQERRPASELPPGSQVTVRFDSEKFSFEKKPDDIAFELTAERVLYEDDQIIVVDKPANFPTEPTMVAGRDNLVAAVARYLGARANGRRAEQTPEPPERGQSALPAPYVGLHHRLDRETSGVILFTKDRSANAAVHRMFLEHLVRKEYRALTVIPPKSPARADGSFSVDNSLGRISPKSAQGKWGAVKTGGDKAHTDFRIIKSLRRCLLVQALPLTGRTHQIRVHLAGVGMPILGDTLYGGPDKLPASPRDRAQTTPGAHANSARGAMPIPRVMLHAASLTFPHPADGHEMTVEAPLPADFSVCLAESAK